MTDLSTFVAAYYSDPHTQHEGSLVRDIKNSATVSTLAVIPMTIFYDLYLIYIFVFVFFKIILL